MKKTTWYLIFSILGLFPGVIIAQPGVYTKKVILYPKLLFNLTPDLVGGIIANIPNNPSDPGSVLLQMYALDPLAADPQGGLLYSVGVSQSSTTYQGTPSNISHDQLGPFEDYMVGNWISNNIKNAATAMDIWVAANRKQARNEFQEPAPVLIKLTVKGANTTVKSVKLPGLAPMDIGSFTEDHFAKVMDAIKNPLNYPDYYIVAAHRGYWKDVPENSLAAYDLTIAGGADMIELDTRLTKDDTLVAFHDECIDRITTGTGKLRDYTWEALKKLKLRDRFGNPTNYRMISIREALQYLKGRALVNLDIKERITKDATGKITDMLTPTMLRAMKTAKETGTLSQLVIKGKLTADDFKDLLEEHYSELGITLADFIYTPVAFGWDTRDMPNYVKDWLQEDIHGIELTYKVAYDPILRYVPAAINKNVRVGIYTFWPEDCNGVISEDNINDPKNYCKFNYRQYYFQMEDGYGTKPDLAPLTPGGDYSGGSSGNDEDYGGGSYDDVNPGPSKKLTRPEFMNDGRGDWDWLFDLGADFVITDRPTLMVQYLEARGKRKLQTPLITEVELPDCPVVSKNGGQSTTVMTNLTGLVRKISDYTKTEFFIPDTRNINLDTTLIIDNYKKYSNDKTRSWARDFLKNNGHCNCADLFKDSLPTGAIRRFPLHSLPEWSKIYPGYDLYINANWFDVKEPWPLNTPTERKYIQQAMYKEPCTNVFGYWQSSPASNQPKGTVLTTPALPIPAYNDFDVLLMTTAGNLVMVSSQDAPGYFNGTGANQSAYALSGYIIAKDGSPVPYNKLPVGSSKSVSKKRSLIGLKGKEMYIAEFQKPMMEVYEAADLMVKYFGCTDVFMFDAGGSSTMLSSRGQFPKLTIDQNNVGPYITSGSAGEDRNMQLEKGYRPIPNFLAIRVK